MIDGKTLIGWGYEPRKWFAEAIKAANALLASGGSEEAARDLVKTYAPEPHLPLREPRSLP